MNSYCIVEVEKFSRLVVTHLNKNVDCIPRSRVVKIHQEAVKFAEKLSRSLSHEENGLSQEILDAKAISQPQLLVKDHKDKDDQVKFSTRLVIPAANFTATLSKIGYMGIKRVLDKHGVDYTKHTIIQSLDLKAKLESLGFRRDKVTMMSLDIEPKQASESAKPSGRSMYGMPPCRTNYRSRYVEQSVEMHASGLDPA
eukprot:1889938-Ditylum_brightwellii.AAC.1